MLVHSGGTSEIRMGGGGAVWPDKHEDRQKICKNNIKININIIMFVMKTHRSDSF
jgi:hypothetical protein